jgi:thymidylate synthase (FAD)
MSIESRLSFLSTTFTREQANEAEGLHRLLQEKEAGTLIECLDDGFVRLVDHMGDDASIVQAARVSYGKGTKTPSDDRQLIRYLMRHRHTTPMEMTEWKFHIRVPMDCWRQWIRHRTASVNEYSTRYSEAIDSMQETTAWRLQTTNNRQGSSEGEIEWPEGYRVESPNDGREGLVVLDDDGRARMLTPFDSYSPAEYLTAREHEIQSRCREAYEERLKFGIAREQARKDLPLSTYTEAYWKIDGHNLLHFLELRMDRHSQVKIRTYADSIAKIIQPIIPLTWEAFDDYRLGSIMLSMPEIEEIKRLIHPDWATQFRAISGREREELRAKLDRLGICYATAG